MFNFFKKQKNNSHQEQKATPMMLDLNHVPLAEGDMVEALRYGLGKCKIIVEEGHYYYESLQSGEKVSWIKMIDAATDLQKVKKI